MSTLKVNGIRGTGASADAITVNATDGTCTAKVTNNLSNRNVIINGEMKINQRGTVSSITSSKYAGPDRWKANLNAGTWTVSQESDGPPGFGSSYKIVCSTAKASLGTGDIVQILHQLEGQDVQRFKKGTSSAQTFSLSFWCKSNYTNTYIAELYDNDNDRCVSKSFTVSSSDTWEKKTFSFPADTTGAFGNDTGASLRVYIKLAAGTDFTSGTLNTSAWIAQDNTKRAGGIGNLAGAVNRFFCVTGVQLEAGDTVTDYEHREYGDELARCQRYLQMWTSDTFYAFGRGNGTADFAFSVPLNVPLRASPSISQAVDSGNWKVFGTTFADNSSSTPGVRRWMADNPTVNLNCLGFDALVDDRCGVIQANFGAGGEFILSAEL